MPSNEVHTVYELDHYCADPRYEGFGLDMVHGKSMLGRKHLYEDFEPSYNSRQHGRDWFVESFKGRWFPPQLEGHCPPFNDYPCINLINPCFSKRAVDCLGDYLTENGELHPVITDCGKFYYYHLMTVADILDLDKSEIQWPRGPKSKREFALEIDHWAIHKEKVQGLSIFHVREMPNEYVTNLFVERVREHNLLGMEFTKVWPWPPGTNWRQEHKKLKQGARQQQESMKQHSLFIKLFPQGSKRTAVEKDFTFQLTDELTNRLLVHSLDEPYYGVPEHRHQKPKFTLIQLSCPDVDKLCEYLTPWLVTLKERWQGRIELIKRQAHFEDPTDHEETIELK